MAGCIDRGLDAVKPEQEVLRKQVEEIQEIAGTLDPKEGNSAQRQAQFQELIERFVAQGDSFYEHLAKVMSSFQPGLFAGGDEVDQIRDNLDLERWFRLLKGHERRIHGHKHAGIRIVQEGSTTALALDAHRAHRGLFTVDDLLPYRSARMPECQRQAMNRRKIMRKARSNLRSAHLTRVFSEFPSSHQYDCVDGMRQRNDVCRNAKRGALNSRHARLPNLTLRYRAGSAVVHLTTTPRLVPSHPSPRVKSYHGVLVRAPRTSRILQLAGLDVSVLERKPQKVSPRQTHAHSAATS